MNLSVVGLGKLGLCTAACFAAKGAKVIGVDSNEESVKALRDKRCPINENDLPELLDHAWPNLTVTHDIALAVEGSEATLIIVPTPSGADGAFINDHLVAVLSALAPSLKSKKQFHIVDIVSTVMPGSCDSVFRPLLEEKTGKICGKDFGLVYNPEFIALGTVIKNFLNPDMVLIGASDKVSGDTIKRLYAGMVDSKPQYAVMSLVNAEITKLSLNCFVTMKISFANEIAALCEKIPGADVDAVTNAIGSDTRVGSKYLRAGLGFGGPCFPRDNIAFQTLARRAGYEAHLGPQVVRINREVPERLLSLVKQHAPTGACVTLLGLSYKPATHIVEESHGIVLAKRLIEEKFTVKVHDPRALDAACLILGNDVEYCQLIEQAIAGTDVLVFLTDWSDYRSITASDVKRAAGAGVVVIDAWRNHSVFAGAGIRYAALGRGQAVVSS